MSDFINLECQGCGASLQVDKDLLHASCPYCGKETIIKHNDDKILELHNRCPVCRRNDRVKKVSSIMTSVEANRHFFAPPQKPGRPQGIGVDAPLRPPVVTSNKPNVGLLIAAGVLIFFALSGLGVIFDDPSAAGGGLFVVAIFALPAYLLIKRYQKQRKDFGQSVGDQQQNLTQYQERVNQYNQALQEQNRSAEEMYQKWIENWQAAVEKWNQLYYCERDDCVFIPGSDEKAPLKDLEKFCYKRD